MRFLLFAIFTMSTLNQCRQDNSNSRRPDNAGLLGPQSDRWILRGRTELFMHQGGEPEISSGFVNIAKSSSHPLATTVAKNVIFDVDPEKLQSPENPLTGLLSYGELRIKNLHDNDLRVCGQDQAQKCQEGLIRIFTTGTPGSGFWHGDENYGLPILSSNRIIGLDLPGAISLAQVTIGSKHVLKLRDFTGSNKAFKIPVSVDFSDAAAGDYSSTLVVEYLLR